MTLLGVVLIFVGIAMLIAGWLSDEPPMSWFGYPGIVVALFGGYLLDVF